MEMQAFSFAASGFVLTAVGHIQRLSSCGTGLVQRFRKCGSFVRGCSGLHGLRHSLVCNGPSPLYRFKCLAVWLDGDRFPVPQHTGSGRSPACGRHSRDDHRHRFEFALCDRSFYALVLPEFRSQPYGSLTVCHRNLVAYLHIPVTVDLGLEAQSMALDK
jgi:hypothetical protein